MILRSRSGEDAGICPERKGRRSRSHPKKFGIASISFSHPSAQLLDFLHGHQRGAMPGLKNPVSVPARSTSASPLSTQARFILGALVGILIASGTIETVNSRRRRQRRNRKPRQKQARASDASDDAGVDFPQATIARPGVVPGVAGLIGNTPLMRINSLSELTGCEILVSFRGKTTPGSILHFC